MNVLVTGAASFIGRHVVSHLLHQGLHVTGTYRSNGPVCAKLAALGAELVQIDLADATAFARLPRRVDAIVHVAGVSAMPGVSVADMLECNVSGAHNLISYAHSAGAQRLIYASTLSVHGRVDESVLDEATPIREADVYGASKYLAERLFAAQSDSLSGASVRLPGVLGAGAHRAWIPTLLESLRSDRDVTIYGPDNPFNNAAHVDDICRLLHGMLQSTEPGFPAFPIGADGSVTVAALVKRMIALTGSRSKVRVNDEPRPSFTISSQFAKDRFRYRPMAIGDMLERYCEECEPAGVPI
jgi:nucleoside-diphosphate-sugar epimerase